MTPERLSQLLEDAFNFACKALQIAGLILEAIGYIKSRLEGKEFHDCESNPTESNR